MAVLKTAVRLAHRGFESLPLRHVGLTRTLGSSRAAEGLLSRGHSLEPLPHPGDRSQVPISRTPPLCDLAPMWRSKVVSTHKEVKRVKKHVGLRPHRDLSVITTAQPPRESSGTLAVWTSLVTATDEVCARPVRSEVHQRNQLFINIE